MGNGPELIHFETWA